MFEITVVVPVYQNRDRVARTIRSVLAQPDIDARVIAVIDDQCRDTLAIVEQLGVEAVFNERNMGAPWCRNRGLALTTSPYVMFLDSDDYLEGNLLAGLCRRMDETGADIAIGQTLCEFDDGRWRREIPLPRETGAAMFEQWCTERAFAAPCSVVWKAEFLRAIGGWDEKLQRSQDSEVMLRAMLRGARSCTGSEGAGIYVQHAAPHRITLSRDYSSCLTAVQGLLAIAPAAHPREVVERAVARRASQIAALAFDVNDAPLATSALALAAELGLVCRPGRAITKLLIGLIGLDATVRLRARIKSHRTAPHRQAAAMRSGPMPIASKAPA